MQKKNLFLINNLINNQNLIIQQEKTADRNEYVNIAIRLTSDLNNKRFLRRFNKNCKVLDIYILIEALNKKMIVYDLDSLNNLKTLVLNYDNQIIKENINVINKTNINNNSNSNSNSNNISNDFGNEDGHFNYKFDFKVYSLMPRVYLEPNGVLLKDCGFVCPSGNLIVENIAPQDSG